MSQDVLKFAPAEGTWVVRAGGAVIGESARALELREGDYAPVIYFPREDLGMTFLDASETTTYCPHKGAARYFTISTKSSAIPDGAWSYEEPHAGAEALKDLIAFYRDRVVIEQT